jgi:hypothetical protein
MSATGAAQAAQETLAERFARLFAAAERARGEEFFQQAAIGELRSERSGWHGSVEAQTEVRLKLNPSGSGLRPSCKCGGRQPCGHAWALLLEVDLLLETAARCAAEHRDWFVFERKSKSAIAWKSPAARSEALRLRAAPAAPASQAPVTQAPVTQAPVAQAPVTQASVEPAAQTVNPGSPTPVATGAAIPMKAPSPEWQRRLRWLDAPFGGPASRVETSERLRLAYALDPQPDAGTALAVQVLIRQRSRSGALAWLPFDQASPAKAAELDLPDRRIIELARGMVRSWDELLLLRHDSRLVIEDPVQDLMLPLLAATGRARWHDWKQHGATGFDAAPLLELDESAPLLFRARLVQCDARVELRPELWRDGNPCALPRIDAVHGAYLRIGPRLHRLDLGPARRLAVDLLGKGPLQAEASEAGALLERLAELPDAERIAGDGIAEQPAPLQVCLGVDAPRDPQGELVLAELSFDYEGTRMAASARQALVRHGGLLAPRDRAAERRAVERLREAGAVPALDDRWTLPRAQLHSLLTALLHAGYSRGELGAALPARRPRLAAASSTTSASAAASPTTWASARRCRCSRCWPARRPCRPHLREPHAQAALSSSRRARSSSTGGTRPRSFAPSLKRVLEHAGAGAGSSSLGRAGERTRRTRRCGLRPRAHHLRHAARDAPSSREAIEFDYAILDEAQAIKNARARRQGGAAAARRAPPGAERHAGREPPRRAVVACSSS